MYLPDQSIMMSTVLGYQLQGTMVVSKLYSHHHPQRKALNSGLNVWTQHFDTATPLRMANTS